MDSRWLVLGERCFVSRRVLPQFGALAPPVLAIIRQEDKPFKNKTDYDNIPHFVSHFPILSYVKSS